MRRRWREIAAGIVPVVLLALLTWSVLMASPVRELDAWVHIWTRDEGPQIAAAFGWLQILGYGVLVVPIVVIASLHLGWRHRSWRPVVATAVAIVPAALVVLGLKAFVGRTAPWTGVDAVLQTAGTAYPSGHTALAALTAGLMTLFARGWRPNDRGPSSLRFVLLVSIATGLLVGWTMIAGEGHWVSDVAAALLLSTPLVVIAHAVLAKDAHPTSQSASRHAPLS